MTFACKRALGGLLALSSMLPFAVAHAADSTDPVAISTGVVLSNLKATLVDLNKYDLYFPSLKFKSGSMGLGTAGYGTPQSVVLQNATPFDSSTGQVTAPPANVPLDTAVVSKTGNSHSVAINMHASTLNAYGGNGNLTTGLTAGAGADDTWTLSPRTQVTITGTLSANAHLNSDLLGQAKGLNALTLAGRVNYTLSAYTGNTSSQTLVDQVTGGLYVHVQNAQLSPTSADVLDASESKTFSITIKNTGYASMLVRLTTSTGGEVLSRLAYVSSSPL